LEGPDLNSSRSPFDKKNYRQILLPNGLRAVLVSDTVAMTQAYNLGGILDDDDDDDDDSSDGDDADEMDVDKDGPEKASNDGDSSDSEGEDDEGGEEGGLRNAAAAMIVGVGSLYDPPECQGMAHFMEVWRSKPGKRGCLPFKKLTQLTIIYRLLLALRCLVISICCSWGAKNIQRKIRTMPT